MDEVVSTLYIYTNVRENVYNNSTNVKVTFRV